MATAPYNLVAFLDERSEDSGSSRTLITGCCIFLRHHWFNLSHEAAKAGQVKARRQLKTLQDVLERIHGIAVVAQATGPRSEYLSGEMDATGDIAAMSRADNIWSQMMAFTICAGIARLHRSRMPLGLVEVYYDSKSLKADHRAVFEATIRRNIAKAARDAVSEHPERFNINQDHLTFGAIEQISKRTHGTKPTPYQQGTLLADILCRQWKHIAARGEHGRFLVKDFSGHVDRTLQAFTESQPL